MEKFYRFRIPEGVCDEILKVADLSTKRIDAKVEGIDEPDHYHRKTEITWLPHSWYDGILMDCGMAANNNWGLDIRDGENIQVGWYGEGSHYKMHADVNAFDVSKGYHRKATIVLCLGDEYTGGELEFDGGPKLSLAKGEIVVFPSLLPHQVHEVTGGTRITAVKWLTGPFWR